MLDFSVNWLVYQIDGNKMDDSNLGRWGGKRSSQEVGEKMFVGPSYKRQRDARVVYHVTSPNSPLFSRPATRQPFLAVAFSSIHRSHG